MENTKTFDKLNSILEDLQVGYVKRVFGELIYKQAKAYNEVLIEIRDGKRTNWQCCTLNIEFLTEKKTQFLFFNAIIFFVILPALIWGSLHIFNPPQKQKSLDPKDLKYLNRTRIPRIHHKDNLTIIKEQIFFNNQRIGNDTHNFTSMYLNVSELTKNNSYHTVKKPHGIALAALSKEYWKCIQILSYSAKNLYQGQKWFSATYKDSLGKPENGNKGLINLNALVQYATGIEYLLINATGNNLTLPINLDVMQMHRVFNSWWFQYFVCSFISGCIICLIAYNKSKDVQVTGKKAWWDLIVIMYEILEIGKDFYYMYKFPRVNNLTLAFLMFAMIFHLTMILFTWNMVSCLYEGEENSFSAMIYGLNEGAMMKDSQRKFFQTLGGSLVHLVITLYESLYFGYSWPWQLYFMPLISFLSISYNIGQRLGLHRLMKIRQRRLKGFQADEEEKDKKQVIIIFCVAIVIILTCVTLTLSKYFVWDDPVYQTHFLAKSNPFEGGRYLWSFIVAFASAVAYYIVKEKSKRVFPIVFVATLFGYNVLYLIMHNILTTLVLGITFAMMYGNFIIAVEYRNKAYSACWFILTVIIIVTMHYFY